MAGEPQQIRRRLMAMMLLTSAAGILLTSASFVTYELITARNQALQQVRTLARIVALNSTAALAFDDRQDAEEVLGALKTEPSIVGAALYDEKGQLFATYPVGEPRQHYPKAPEAEGYAFAGGHLDGFQRISELPDQPLGTLFIRADMSGTYERFWLYGVIAAAVMSASLLLAYILSRLFQRRISMPVLSLADTARAISERGDFSVRAPLVGDGEFALLTHTFNHMLSRIDAQNSALKDNEERLRAVLNSALSAVVVMDANGIITDWNARAEAIFGWPRDEAIGRLLSDTIVPHAQRELHRAGLERFLSTSHGNVIGRTVELSALRRDGSECPVEVSITVLSEHSPPTFCGFLTDITERKQARSRLQVQLARLDLLQRTTRAIGERQDLQSIFQVIARNLEDNLPVDFACLCQYDKAAGRLTVSTIGTKSLARSNQLAIEVGDPVPLDDADLARCVSGVLVYEPDVSTLPSKFLQRFTAAGLRAFVAAPLLLESKVFGVLITARTHAAAFSSGDCEFLRQLSEHVALATHQAQLYTALQQAYDDLRLSQQTILQQERLRALGQMASGVAHDINNAISPVTLYTESLLEREPNLSDRAKEYLRTIQRAVADVGQTVARMREFYRQRDQQADLSPLDLNLLVDQALMLTRARWSDMPQERGIVITIRKDLTADLPRMMGTESDIRDALTNLVFNAVDAMPVGGTLTIRTRVATAVHLESSSADQPNIELEVSDTGMGMDDDTRRRCLEPFFTTKGERGTGMGLAMVYGMVERHGAQLEIDSVVGHGTTIRLRFIAASRTAAATVYTSTMRATGRLHLLVVDDDPLLREALFHILEAEGHAVTIADGGQAGIDLFATALSSAQPFDVVMTDLGMPYMDGRAVAAAVKERSPTTPVLLLTGWGQRLSTEQSIPANVDFVLGKPPKLPELRRALAELSQPAAEHTEPSAQAQTSRS